MRRVATGAEWSAGWPVVAAAAIGVGVGLSSLLTYSFGVLVKPITATLGWSRGEANGLHFFVALATMIAAPVVGVLVDRFGPRRVALIGIPIAAAGYASFATIGPSLTLYYGLAFAVGGLAQATGPIIWTRTVSGWFRDGRGLALATTLAGTGVFALLGPPAVTAVVTRYGWRTAFLVLGGLMLISWGSTFLWLRDQPRHPPVRPGVNDVVDAPAAAPGVPLREALRSRVFWTIAAGLFLASLGATAMIAHLVPMLTDRGVAPRAAAWVASTLGVSVVGGRLLAGWCLDRMPTGRVCAAVMSSAALGCLVMLTFDGRQLATAVVAAMLVGVAAGGEVDLVAYLAAKYFGLASYGKIYGVLYACFSIGAGSSPALAGFMFDASGNYQRALTVLALAFTGSAVLLGSLGPDTAPNATPRRPAAADGPG